MSIRGPSFQVLLTAAALSALAVCGAYAAECPKVPEPHLPAIATPLNIDKVKEALRAYHKGDYPKDMATVYAVAQSYVESRAGQVKNPAVVFDIDETTLSNWPNIDADDFGFIQNGRCNDLPHGPCGFNAWILKATAKAFPPALSFYDAVKSKHIAVIFLTARRESQRQVTVRNLKRAGYDSWAKLILKRDKDDSTAGEYKAAARAKIVKEGKYTIIANIGDQLSDLSGGSAECTFKLPNPFYFIP